MICLIVLPRWYYQTHSTASTMSIINAIYTSTAVEIRITGESDNILSKINHY